jgi:hypothetical protein
MQQNNSEILVLEIKGLQVLKRTTEHFEIKLYTNIYKNLEKPLKGSTAIKKLKGSPTIRKKWGIIFDPKILLMDKENA